MFSTASFDALTVAHARGDQLRDDALAERLRVTATPCRTVAGLMRRAAHRLDCGAHAQRPVTQS